MHANGALVALQQCVATPGGSLVPGACSGPSHSGGRGKFQFCTIKIHQCVISHFLGAAWLVRVTRKKLFTKLETGEKNDAIRRRFPRAPEAARSRSARIPPGGGRGAAFPLAVPRGQPALPGSRHHRTHRRTRAGDPVPRALGRLSGPGTGQPWLPGADEQRHRPVQGRPALPPLGQPRGTEVPRLRAGLQELPDHSAHGRRQGRLRLRSEGQERRRGDAFLPVVHERAVPSRRRRPGRAGRRHRRRRA